MTDKDKLIKWIDDEIKYSHKVTTKGLNQPKDWECPHCGGTEAFPDPSGYATYQSGGWGCIECQS